MTSHTHTLTAKAHAKVPTVTTQQACLTTLTFSTSFHKEGNLATGMCYINLILHKRPGGGGGEQVGILVVPYGIQSLSLIIWELKVNVFCSQNQTVLHVHTQFLVSWVVQGMNVGTRWAMI